MTNVHRTVALGAAALILALPVRAAAIRPRIYRVCNGTTTPCPRGTRYKTIAAAVQRIQRLRPRPDRQYWILVWPGVYHEKQVDGAGVLITTPNVHIRGMDRNLVVVDGSNGDAAHPCPSDAALQDFTGREGIEVFKTDGTSIDNLTVCNYLDGPNGDGNEIWWNGGDGTGLIGMRTYSGSYLTATSTFFGGEDQPMGQYGIFVSNAQGPGTVSYSYASNMADSSFYVGACPDCNAVLSHVHAQNSPLGYSGTNSGGHLRIEDSEWDGNMVGILPNSLNNDDAPPPQSGLCPDGSGSCMFIQRNFVHDNNNPNVPCSGITCEAPVGTGIEISGGSYDTITDNQVENQGAWGIATHDFPDTETPPPVSNCEGGIGQGSTCLFVAMGNLVTLNQLAGNGFFGNPTNGDLVNESTSTPRNCFSGNTDIAGLTSEPPMIETVDGPPCDQPGIGSATAAGELACDAGLTPCPPGSSYPTRTQVTMLPLTHQDPMPDPCAGVPRTRWCPYAGPRS